MISGSFRKAARSAVAAMAVSGILFALAGVASAQQPYGWDPSTSGGTAAGGSGAWSNSATSWWNGTADVVWSAGADAVFGGSAGTATISGGVSANNVYFNTAGYAIAASSLTLTGGSVTVPANGIDTITSSLSAPSGLTVLGGGSLAVNGGLTLGTAGSIDIASTSGNLLLGGNSTINLLNGGTINGNLVLTGGNRVNFDSQTGSPSGLAPNVATYSGSGSIQVQKSLTIISCTSGMYGGAINVPVQLNSLNLPFTKTDVTQNTIAYPSTNAFSVAMGATKYGQSSPGPNGYMAFNAPISGNSDVVFSTNSATGGGGAAVTLLNAQCTYTGTTFMDGNGGQAVGTQGTLILGVSNAFPVSTDFVMGFLTPSPSHHPELDLNGNNTQIGSLSMSAAADVPSNQGSFFVANNAVGTLATLTVSGATTPANPYGGSLINFDTGYLGGGTLGLSGGTLALYKAGTNTLKLSSGTSTFSGGTTIAGGIIQVLGNLTTATTAAPLGGSALGLGPVTVQSGGALAGSSVGGGVAGLTTVQAGGQLMPGGIGTSGPTLSFSSGMSMQSSSSLTLTYGQLTSSASAQVAVGGSLTLPLTSDSVKVDLIPQKALTEVTPLFSFGNLSNGTASIGSLVLADSAILPPGFFFALDSSLGTLGSGNANQIDLVNLSIGSPVITTWAGSLNASGSWDANPANIVWKASGGSSTSFQSNYATVFSDIPGSNSGTVTISSTGVQPGSVAINSNSTAYTFTGGPIAGYTSLTLTGSSVTTLAASNSYSGGTYVSAGTLVTGTGDASLGNTVGGLYLDNGAMLVTSNSGINSSRNVFVGTGGTTSTGGVFNSNGQNSTFSGNVFVGNTGLSSTLTKTGSGSLTLAGATALTDGAGQNGAVLSVQGGSLQISGGLSLGNYGSFSIGPSGTVTLSAANATVDQNNGGVINGNLVLAQAVRLNFNSGTFSGTGQIQVQNSGAYITNKNTSFAGTIDPNIVFNSLNLPFTKTDVTQSSINTSGSSSFIGTIGGTKNAAVGPSNLIINGVISGNSDVNFSNSTGGGGSGNITLNQPCTYTGATLIDFTGNVTGGAQGGIVMLGTNNALPTSTDVMFGAIGGVGNAWLDLEGFNQQIGSLCTVTAGTDSMNFTITNQKFNSTGTLAISGSTTPYQPFAGTIADLGTGLVAIAKSGANTLVVTGPNNYSGGTTVAGGMLIINNPNLQQTAAGTGFVTVSGGTFGGIGNLGDPGYSKGTPAFSVSAGAALYVGVPASGATANTNGTLYVNGNLNLAAGAALDFDFGAGSASQLNLGSNGAASLNLPGAAASVAVNLTNLNGLTGELPLIQSNTAIANTGSLYIGSAVPAGDSYALSYDSVNDAIDLTISSTAVKLTWAGTADSSPHAWDVNATPNFNGARQTFNNGDFVTFDDTGVGGAVSITASGVAPGSLVFSNTAKSYSLSGGPIYGATSLVLNGAGIVTLGSGNSYTGGTNISGGTLIAAAGDSSLGASSGTVSISGGATLATSNAGIVSGRDITIGAGGGTFNTNGLNSSTSGALTVNAPFTVTGGGNFGFTTAADFSGTNSSLTITSGSATLSGNGTVNFRGGGTFNGSLVISGSSSRVNFDNYLFGGSGSIQVQNGGVVTASNTSAANGWPLLSNTAIGGQSLSAGTLGSNLAIDLNSNGAPFSSAATNLGSAPFVLQTNHNFITGIGATTPGQVLDVQASISGNADVVLGSNSNHGNGGAATLLLSGSNTYTGATLMAGNGVVQLGASNTLPTTTDLIFGTVSNDTPTLDLHGYNQQINSLSEGGAYAFSITNGGSSPSILTVSGTTSPATAFSGTIRDGSSTIELVKDGAGTLELSGSNSYSGGTYVLGGALIVENAEGLNDGSNLSIGNELSKFGALVPAASPIASPGSATAVPEPCTMALALAGGVFACWQVRRRRRK
jgi:fibronectin-binding autotransporter adhesin